MLCGKQIFIILLLAVCHNIYSFYLEKSINVGQDAFETAEALLVDLNTTVETELSYALESLSLQKDNADAMANALESNASYEVLRISLKFSSEVTNISSQAGELGIAEEVIRTCAVTCNQELYIASTVVLEEITLCVNSTLRESVGLINRTIEDLKTVRITVAYDELQIEQCKFLPDGEECILGLIEEMYLQFIDLPAKIREDTARTTAVVKALESTFNECSTDRMDSITPLGDEAISELRKCVEIE